MTNGLFNITEFEKELIPQYKGKKFQEFVNEIYEKLNLLFGKTDLEFAIDNIYEYQKKQLYYYCYDNKINYDEFLTLEHNDNPCFPIYLPLSENAMKIYMTK